MSIFQGRQLDTIIEKIPNLEIIENFFKTPTDDEKMQKLKEQLDEILNFIKLKEYLMSKQYTSFHLKIAPNTYYNWSLQDRQKFLLAPSEDYLCKTIVMKNKKFLPQYAIQYNTTLKNEKLIKVMREYNQNNCNDIVPRKGFHYRLASEEENDNLTGFRHNSVTPYMLNVEMPIIVSERIKNLPDGYFWMGGGHENTKLSYLKRNQFRRI